MPTQNPTARQTQILEFIRTYQTTWGMPPTYREIGKEVGLTPGAVFNHLNALEKRGLLTRNLNERRSIQLT